MDPFAGFHAPVRTWFGQSFRKPTRIQTAGWESIRQQQSTLLLAPTGSGKTLAAFLAALDRLLFSAQPSPPERCRVLYISPLKALAVDIERNLRAPLVGIAAAAERAGQQVTPISVDIRTGDTAQKDRMRMKRHPPDILVTTPESVYLLLTSEARSILASVDTVIVDEIHSLVSTKRGAHLFVSLERLEALRSKRSRPLQRIGLSATQRPLDEIARLLGGFSDGTPRPVTLVDAGRRRKLDLRVEVPIEDMRQLGKEDELASGPVAHAPRKSIWPSIVPRLIELIREHRSTMIFVNSRRLAERLAAALNEQAGELIAACHHGSIAREARREIEDQLKRGELPSIVATSSLELGVDMGAVDLVIQIEAPPSVASGIQRIGRANHSVGKVSRGVVFPKYRGELMACATAVKQMHAGEVEETLYPRNPLDILAQQLLAMVTSEPDPVNVNFLYTLVRRAAPFAELPRTLFDGVLDMLSGRYPSDDFAELRPRLVWDRLRETIRARPGAKRIAIMNGGTIPDRGLYGVFLATQEGKTSRRVGELDEEMVFETKPGEVFLLGTSSWRVEEITHDRVLVTPAPGEPGKMPFWHGDRPGRPLEFGIAIGSLCRELAKKNATQATESLIKQHGFNEHAANNLVTYLGEQLEATQEVPSDQTIVVERSVDELGDTRICVLSPFGARIHAPWAMAVVARLEAERAMPVDSTWSDDGMVFRIAEGDTPEGSSFDTSVLFPSAADVRDRVVSALNRTSLFAARFRECASRALLLPKRAMGKRTALWMQRKRAADLLTVASRYPAFPIVLETYRECLQDVFDLPGLIHILQLIEARRIRVVTATTRHPSPFAASLLFSYIAEFLYEGDSPLAERRAQALRIDHAQLRELLGDAELRELLDPEAIGEYEQVLQRLDPRYLVRDPDALHDLLLSVGDLTRKEIRARTSSTNLVEPWLKQLETECRAVRVRLGNERRWVAAEDANRYRDALGVVLPPGLPAAFLEPAAEPLSDLVSRYARTHGPFMLEAMANRFSLGVAMVRSALEKLSDAGRVVEGEFLPHGHSREWCSTDVLRVLRTRSLAKLRKEIEPVDATLLGMFLPVWQGLTRKRKGSEGLLAVIRQLQGGPLVASVLESDILPSRLENYTPSDLDMLFLTGEVVWAGAGSLGPHDGRVVLYRAEDEPLLSRPAQPVEGEIAARIRELLSTRGALFFSEIARTLGGFANELAEQLWDMIWAGEITNDTLAPLRSYWQSGAIHHKRSASRIRPRRGGGALPGTEGRWSLRSMRLSAHQPSGAERAMAFTRMVLERYGVVLREAVAAEGVTGGFSALYPVLKELEERGHVRRGYFLSGCGATQFALPGADDQLRALRDTQAQAMMLATTDPANPYGAALPWPPCEEVRLQRVANSYVILHQGSLAGYWPRGEQSLCTLLPADEPMRKTVATAIANLFAELVETGRRRTILITQIDGKHPSESPLAQRLVEAGFVAMGKGYIRRRNETEATSSRYAGASIASSTGRRSVESFAPPMHKIDTKKTLRNPLQLPSSTRGGQRA